MADRPMEITVSLSGVQGLLSAGRTNIYDQAQAAMDRAFLVEVLEHFNGNQSVAARALGLARYTLRKKIRSLGITPRPQNPS